MSKIQLSQKQITYVMAKVAIQNKQQAIEYFAGLLVKEGIDPAKRMSTYVTLMMQKDGVK